MCCFSLIEPRHGRWIVGEAQGKRVATADEDAATRDQCDARTSHQVGLRRYDCNRPTHTSGGFVAAGSKQEENDLGVARCPPGTAQH